VTESGLMFRVLVVLIMVIDGLSESPEVSSVEELESGEAASSTLSTKGSRDIS
jgi:hypothetical protein